jgi:hypothetical protein
MYLFLIQQRRTTSYRVVSCVKLDGGTLEGQINSRTLANIPSHKSYNLKDNIKR